MVDTGDGFIDTQLITLSGRGSKISTKIPQPIKLDHEHYDYRLGLKTFQMYNSIPNIEEDVNNCLKIRPGKGEDFILIKLDSGAYEITHIYSAILTEVQNMKPTVKEPEKNFILAPNTSTFKSQITLSKDWAVDFNVDYSIAEVLGFVHTDVLSTNGIHKSENIVQIQVFNSLLFMTNVTYPSIVRGQHRPYIYHHSMRTPPGYNIVVDEPDVAYKSLTASVLDSITVWIEDERGNAVNINNEYLTVELKLIRKLRRHNNTGIIGSDFG